MSPVRLHKKEETNVYGNIQLKWDILERKLEKWVLNHATLVLFVCMAFLVALFVVLMMAICGVSATESGVIYNHMEAVV